MYVFLRFFYVFFKIQKHDFLRFFLSCCTRFPEQWGLGERREALSRVRGEALAANAFSTLLSDTERFRLK